MQSETGRDPHTHLQSNRVQHLQNDTAPSAQQVLLQRPPVAVGALGARDVDVAEELRDEDVGDGPHAAATVSREILVKIPQKCAVQYPI